MLVLFAGLFALLVGYGFYIWSSSESSTINVIDPNQRLIPFRKGDKWGFSDKNQKLIIDAKYDRARVFSEGLARVALDDKWGFIDKTGNEVTPLKYDSYLGHRIRFSEGLAQVRLNNKYGFIDKTGKEVIPLKYDYGPFSDFSEGLAEVMLNGKWFYIDKKGTEYYEP